MTLFVIFIAIIYMLEFICGSSVHKQPDNDDDDDDVCLCVYVFVCVCVLTEKWNKSGNHLSKFAKSLHSCWHVFCKKSPKSVL